MGDCPARPSGSAPPEVANRVAVTRGVVVHPMSTMPTSRPDHTIRPQSVCTRRVPLQAGSRISQETAGNGQSIGGVRIPGQKPSQMRKEQFAVARGTSPSMVSALRSATAFQWMGKMSIWEFVASAICRPETVQDVRFRARGPLFSARKRQNRTTCTVLLLPPRHHPHFPSRRDRPNRKRIINNLRLLLLVPLAAPCRRARALTPPHVPHFAPRLVEQGLYVLAHDTPRTHIPRLLLRPDHLRRRTIPRQKVARLVGGERIELLHAEQRHVVRLAFLARGQQIVVDLAGAEDHARDARVVTDASVAQNFGEDRKSV